MLWFWLFLCGAALIPAAAGADNFTAAYGDPTTRYAHGVLGDAVEWGALEITGQGKTRRVILPQDRVFEDIAPRLWDVTGDGIAEIVVIETAIDQGAQLAIYDRSGAKIAATPHIGRTHRWLAPIGAGDFDGDGLIEIAYIDRPHLAKILKIWRFDAGELVQIVELSGLTNHRIGEDFITGGLRDCAGRPTLIVVSGSWAEIMQVEMNQEGKVSATSLGPYTGAASIKNAMAC